MLEKDIFEEENKQDDLKEEIAEDSKEESIENTEETVQNEELVESKQIEETTKPKKKSFRERRREKKLKKINKEFFREEDIKFRAPFSYRHLRIIGWLAFALSQFCTINQMTSGLTSGGFMNETAYMILGILSSLYLPLFIIATFGTILNKSKTYKAVLTFYGGAYLGLGLAVVLVYHRYINGIMATLNSETTYRYAGDLLGSKLLINVFADLFALSSFYFFVMYRPKKYFQGKKRIIFRLFSLIPLVIALISYIIRISTLFVSLPIQIYPFLTTKSPILYGIFIILVLWLKHREKKYLSFGKTEEEYDEYIKTKRNQKSYSIMVSKLLAIGSVVDFVALIVLAIFAGENTTKLAKVTQLGNCSLLFLAIPLIMFYSYIKTHKQDGKDLLIPLIGVGLSVLAYVEGIYDVIIYILSQNG